MRLYMVGPYGHNARRRTCMIISASRRTDLPALYSEWFIRRVRAGFCVVPNPFNPRQLSTVSLSAEMVDAVVFWSRFPRPLTRRLHELGPLGERSAFLLTLLDYPRWFEPHSPAFGARLDAFLEVSRSIGPGRVVWRYDPIILSDTTDANWHAQTFERLCRALQGATHRVVVSVMDPYAKARRRLAELTRHGTRIDLHPGLEDIRPLLAELSTIAQRHGMSMQSCAQSHDYSPQGVQPGACIDAPWLNGLFETTVEQAADKGQRKHCLCAPSRDIGMYDSCIFGCACCYATADFVRARKNRRQHDPDLPTLLPVQGATTNMPLPLG